MPQIQNSKPGVETANKMQRLQNNLTLKQVKRFATDAEFQIINMKEKILSDNENSNDKEYSLPSEMKREEIIQLDHYNWFTCEASLKKR